MSHAIGAVLAMLQSLTVEYLVAFSFADATRGRIEPHGEMNRGKFRIATLFSKSADDGLNIRSPLKLKGRHPPFHTAAMAWTALQPLDFDRLVGRVT